MRLTGRVEDINRRHGWASPEVNISHGGIVELQKRWPVECLHTIKTRQTFWSPIFVELADNDDTFEPFGSQRLHDLAHIGRDIDNLTIVYISIGNEEQFRIDLRNETRLSTVQKGMPLYHTCSRRSRVATTPNSHGVADQTTPMALAANIKMTASALLAV